MPACGGQAARVSWGESSTYACIARIAFAAAQTGECGLHNKGISHVWISYMRVSPNPDLLSEGENISCIKTFNRISLPFPKL